MVSIRASGRQIARWSRQAKAANVSFNQWACLVLDGAPAVRPAVLSGKRRQARHPVEP